MTRLVVLAGAVWLSFPAAQPPGHPPIQGLTKAPEVLGERERAIDLLTTLIAERPARPHGSVGRATALLAERRTKN